MKLKIRGKIIGMALVPVVLLGAVIMYFSQTKISDVVTEELTNTLRATALSVRDMLTYSVEGDYEINAEGELVKGNFNVTRNEQIADAICAETGVEVTVFYGDTRYMTSVKDASGKRALGTKAAGEVVEKVLKDGEAYFAENVDVAGTPFFAYYVPFYADGSRTPAGMVFAGISQERLDMNVRSNSNGLLLIILLVSVFTGLMVVFVVRGMFKALHASVSALEELAEGSLKIEISDRLLNRYDEIGAIGRSIKKLSEQLSEIVTNIKGQCVVMNDSANLLKEQTRKTVESITQVERAVGEIAEGAENQAEETQRATENVVTIGDMIGGNMQDTEALNKNAVKMQSAGEEVMKTFGILNETNRKTMESIHRIHEQTNTTNQSAQKIQEATNLITSIAEETNLLALNASIEAARAGEQGRGFAVVAAQIQKLAEQSNVSAGQITDIVNLLLRDSAEAVETMRQVQETVQTQDKDMRETNAKLEEVLKGIENSLAMVNKVTKQTEQMDEARTNVIDVVQSLTAISQENAASTQETLASMTLVNDVVQTISTQSAELKTIADEINKKLEVFRL